MQFHPHVIEKLLYLSANHGGHQDEKRLLAQINMLRLSPYVGERSSVVLVDSQTYINECNKTNKPVNHIIPMKLHGTVVAKFMQLYDMYAGHINETKLRNAIKDFDLTPYERKENPGETILVLTSDYVKIVQGIVES